MAHQDDRTSFVTFGMFIIDEIEWQTPNPPPPKTNLIGGAGTYAVLGGRLAASPSQPLSRTISWIVDIGSDFPPEVKSTIDSWNTDCIFRCDPNRLTTRAWNGYGANDLRAFNYLTPKVRLEVSSLNSAQTMAKSFHMVCSPDRCIDLTTRLREARRALNSKGEEPVIVWEPIPDLCNPEQLFTLQTAARKCTVISPNHEELKMFFPPDISNSETQSQLVMRFMGWKTPDDRNASTLAPSSISSFPVVIVREGSNGSTAYIRRSTSKASSEPMPIAIHLPAYHTPKMSSSVTDPTGGGNTYLGALAMTLGLLATNNLAELPIYNCLSKQIPLSPIYNKTTGTSTNSTQHEHKPYLLPMNTAINSDTITPAHTTVNTIASLTHAMTIALIAASFAIEQNGTPHLKVTDKVGSEFPYETWNSETFEDRTRKYLEREGGGIRESIARISRSDNDA